MQSTTSSDSVGANAVKGMGGVHPIVDQAVDKVTLVTVVMDLWEAKNIMSAFQMKEVLSSPHCLMSQ